MRPEASFATERFEGTEERWSGLASADRDTYGFEHLARLDGEGFRSAA